MKLQVLLSPAIHKLSWIIWLPFSENREKKGTRGNCGVIYHRKVTQDFNLNQSDVRDCAVLDLLKWVNVGSLWELPVALCFTWILSLEQEEPSPFADISFSTKTLQTKPAKLPSQNKCLSSHQMVFQKGKIFKQRRQTSFPSTSFSSQHGPRQSEQRELLAPCCPMCCRSQEMQGVSAVWYSQQGHMLNSADKYWTAAVSESIIHPAQ